MSVNKVILIGRLGKDPEVKLLPTGSKVANFSVATSKTWKDKSGEKQERTEWHKVVVWNKTAELVEKYLSKGREVYIEGELQTRDWEDKDGNKRYTTEVVANQINFLGSKPAGQGQAESSGQQPSQPSFSEDDIPL